MKIHLYQNDLPSDLEFLAPGYKGEIAIDTEAMGLKAGRDRLCLVQISLGDGICHLVQISPQKMYPGNAPNLKKLLENKNILKIFHFARFDLGKLQEYLGCKVAPVFCTKVASKLTRTYTDRHSLKELCREILKIDISKEETCSDWGQQTLSPEQLKYAATDVLYLHELKKHLALLLKREDRHDMAQACFNFLPDLAEMDTKGFNGDEVIRY